MISEIVIFILKSQNSIKTQRESNHIKQNIIIPNKVLFITVLIDIQTNMNLLELLKLQFTYHY